MAESSEVTILCREIKKAVSEIRGRDEVTNRILKINEELRLKVIKQDMVITEMKRKLASYENPLTSVWQQHPSTKEKVRTKKYFKRGQVQSKVDKKGWQPRRLTLSQVFADRCKKCNSTGLTHKKVHQKQVTDIRACAYSSKLLFFS